MKANEITSLIIMSVLLALCCPIEAVSNQWTEPVPLTIVNSPYVEEWSPCLSFDGLILYFARVRSDASYYGKIFEATRAEPFGPFTSVQMLDCPLNDSMGHQLCPWVSTDNLRMYYHNESGGIFKLMLSERSSVYDPWPVGISIEEINVLGDRIQDPTLTADELTIVFKASDIPDGMGSYDLWIATRPDKYSQFTQVRNLAEVNTDVSEGSPFISSNGLELYFSSNLNGQNQLFKTTRRNISDPFGNIVHLSQFDTPGGSSSQPCLNYNGGELYFMRQRGANRSTRDIYVSYNYRNPVRFVDAVNGDDLNNGLSLQTAFATIQQGIDSAEDGFTVLVYPGVYTEEINFRGKAITVKGVAGPDGVPVLENPGDFAVSFENYEGSDSVLKNFIIRNSFMGIFIAGSSPTISNLTIVDNVYGIKAYARAQPDIRNCIFWNNSEADLFGCETLYSWVQDNMRSGAPECRFAYWSFDECSETTVFDIVGNNHGVIHGAQCTTGLFGNALSFDGVDDYVDFGVSGAYMLDQNISFSAWINRNAERQAIISIEGGPDDLEESNALLYLGVTSGGHLKYIHEYGVGRNEEYDFGVVPQGIWTHVVVVRDSNTKTVTAYLNGVLDNIFYYYHQPENISSELNMTLGSRSEGLHNFEGLIDEAALFDRALSAAEVEQIYNSDVIIDNDISNPLFVNPRHGDYHLFSERGRYWPEHNVWVLDNITSPCIDAGEPMDDPSGEPMPNGGFINMGAYGGTRYASMSEMPWPDPDVNRDGVIDTLDLAELVDQWLAAAGWID